MPARMIALVLVICGIAYLAIGCDAPRPDRVVVIKKILAPYGEQLGQRRLDVAGFVGGTTLDNGWLAVPSPGQAKARQCPGQDRLLQLCLLPGLAVIDGHVDPPDLAASAPGNSIDLVKSGSRQLMAAGGTQNDGLCFHDKRELACGAVRH